MKSQATSRGRRKIRLLSKKRDTAPPALPLAAAGPAKVQFVRSDGKCWDATFAGGDISQNDTTKFRAKQKAP